MSSVNSPILDLPLLNKEEKHQLLVEWNQTEADYPKDRCVHELFEEQVKKTPKSIAAVYEGQELSYEELNNRANQVAHTLKSLKVQPDVLVGICMDRSLEMLVGILGVLKSGGAYVPLDPDYPKERLAFMIEDSGVQVILTQERLAELIPKHKTRVFSLDSEWEKISKESKKNPKSGAKPDNLAYVIYTSGSTGKPKGCLLQHRGLCNLFYAQVRAFGIESNDRIVQFASISFDASIFETVMALLSGATLCLGTRDSLMPGPDLIQFLREKSITVATLPGSALTVMSSKELPALRIVITAGEACPADLVKRWGKNRKFFNAYGPTEATIWSTVAECKDASIKPPIGRPIGNTQIYILDSNLQPVPIGITGEIHIAGVGLARGYLNRPELTAEKFIPNPFSDKSGTRLYKTGDLARYLADGNIEFLGRIDHQVKIRGFRIELGEIESVLRQNTGIKEACVIAREDVPGEKKLVAYFVKEGKKELKGSDIRNFLNEKLPPYMLPSTFVSMESLPLTANGKVDRKALPLPRTDRSGLSNSYVAPQSPIEKTLAKIWSDILAIDDIGVNDTFHDLGGNSLQATRILSKLHKVLGITLSIRAIFDTPRLKDLALLIEKKQQEGNSIEEFSMKSVARPKDLPLNFSQERIWFVQNMSPESKAYHAQAAIRFKGKLDSLVVEKCLNEIIRRHEVFRTTFPFKNGHPVQEIQNPPAMKLPLIDLKETPADKREAIVHRIITQDMQQPFNLNELSLIRWSLIKLNEDEHVLAHVEHHIIHDGWSFNVFLTEFLALYKSFSCGKPSPLPELTIQFADFACWQRKWMEGRDASKQRDYWIKQLEDCPPLLALPLDHSRPPIQKFRGANIRTEIPDKLCDALRAFNQEENSTLYMTLLQALTTLLHLLSGQEDLCIGAGIANRRWEETEGMLGMLINNVVLRADLSGEPTVREMLRRIRELTLDAYAHQDLPFDSVIEALKPERSLSHNPLFQVMFSMHDSPMPDLDIPGVTVDIIPALGNGSAKFDLTLVAIPHSSQQVGVHSAKPGDGLTLIWEYNSALFDESTILRMTRTFQVLLESIIGNPEQQISKLLKLSTNERQKILIDWNSTSTPYPKDVCIHEHFKNQAAKNPQAIAVVLDDHQMTYAELDRRSNQLAHVLRKQGVGPGHLVGICVERSMDFMVGLLAILKAGGAYVPLNSSYPLERLTWMIKDAKISLLLTQHDFLKDLPVDGVKTMCLDTEREKISREPETNLENNVSADSLAYVMYTSGSTGKPKGVTVPHRGVMRLVVNTDYVHLDSSETLLNMASNSFDASTFEIWGALLNGGKCVLFPEQSPSTQKLGETIDKHGITTMWLTSALFNLVIDEAPQVLAPVKQLLIGGEALSVPHVRRALDLLPSTQIINGYGPTEGTTFTCCYPIPRPLKENLVSIPIGYPINNTQVFILNSHLQPVPVGVPGELCIGGDGLAKGYLGKNTLTKEKFVPSPFQPGEVLYRTGDQVRWQEDGSIEFLGRMDNQVKIRGFRIELGEIESTLIQCPKLKEAVLTVFQHSNGQKDLCAYVTTRDGGNEEIIREYLKERLPHYMIPSSLILLDKMPLNQNGKVDRKALPHPTEDVRRKTVYQAPENPSQEKLVSIFEEVLGVSPIGIQGHFFELGGHSLKAMALCTQIQKGFGVHISLSDIFQNPLVEDLAKKIAHSKVKHYLPIQPAAKRPYYPMSSTQKRLYTLHHMDGMATTYNVPFALALMGSLDRQKLETAFKEVIKKHEALRTGFEMVGNEFVQKIYDSVPFHLDFEENAESCGPDLIAKYWNTFDLAKPPLLKATLIRRKDRDHLIFLNFHHIITDGVSMGILLKDLSLAYNGGVLEPLTIQYKDFTLWQEKELTTNKLKDQEDFWLDQLKGELPVLSLQTDFKRPPIKSYEGDRHRFRIDRTLTATIKEFCSKHEVSLHMFFLAVFKVLLTKHSGQEDILVGLPAAGRIHEDSNNMMGMFVNTLAFRSQPAGDKRFLDYLLQVKEDALEMYENQGYPFDQLVDKIVRTRDTSRHPFFDVMFEFQNTNDYVLSLSGIEGSPVLLNPPYAKFDLLVSGHEEREGIDFSIEYGIKLFRADSIVRLGQHYVRAMQSVMDSRDQTIQNIEILSEQEKQKVLVDWNSTSTPYPKDVCIHEHFKNQVQQHPNAIAVASDTEQITYTELNQRANRLAHTLTKLGVGPNHLVGLCLDRSSELMVGMLAILKAGGAYVPLDLAYPKKRLSWMIKDAKIKVLITQKSLLKDLPTDDVKTLCLDSDQKKISSEPATDPVNRTSATNIAYVMYTSGSTGEPKGVTVPHRGVMHLVVNTNYVHLDSNETLLNMAVNSFDASTFEIWGALLNGGKCVLFPERIPSTLQLGETIDKHGVTTMWLTSALFNLIIDEAPQVLAPVKQLLIGGEALSVPHVRRALDLLPSTQIINGYGPTEGTTFTCCYSIPRPLKENILSIPIGRPINHTQAFVLDKHLQPVPVGVPGELCIGGDGLARGYLGRQDLTKEKFIPSPFQSGEVLYRSGDLGRWMDDGNIEFLGRMDNQVKIRGFRIELGEIESTLLQCSGLKEAVLTVFQIPNGQKDLCAYITIEEGVSVTTIREYLAEKLPHHMIPSSIVLLDKMPLNQNGKIDKKALPHPIEGVGSETLYQAPENPTQEKLVSIFEEVLGVSPIGIQGHFFELGGHSLKAMTLCTQIRKTFGVHISLADIFQNPLVKDLAKKIAHGEEKNYTPIKPVAKQPHYPMSSTQRRLYALHHMEGMATTYNVPFAFVLKGSLDRQKLETAFKEVIKKHEALRTGFQIVGNEFVQKIYDSIAFHLAFEENAEILESEIIDKYSSTFDLTQPPLLQATLIQRKDKDHVLFLNLHHIIIDGVSMGILLKDLSLAYGGAALEPLPVQYKDFTLWQEEELNANKLKDQEEFWLDRLKGELPVLSLGTDYKRPPVKSYKGNRHYLRIDKPLTKTIKEFCSKHRISLHMFFLAVFKVVLAKYSGQEDIIVGLPAAGRVHEDSNNIMGMFVNTLAFRSQPAGDKRFLDYLLQLKEDALEMYENQGYPFDRLVDKIVRARDTSRHPLFDVMFEFQNTNDEVLFLPGVEVLPIRLNPPYSKFDILVSGREEGKGIDFSMEYGIKLFREDTISRLGQHYVQALQSVMEAPDKSIKNILILSEQEKQELKKFDHKRQTDSLDSKTDKQALPEPKNPVKETTVTASSLKMEQTIKNIWQDVLGRQSIGPNDNFFESGGNSLNIITVNHRLNKQLNLQIPVTTLFQYSTIRSLSAHLEDESQTSNGKEEKDDSIDQEAIAQTVDLFRDIDL